MSTKVLDSIHVNFPSDEEGIASAFESCKTRKRFVEVEREQWKNHLEIAKDDLSALQTDMDGKNWRWVITKAYYAVFHATNALLVAKLGFYSKDHLCAVIALKHENLLSDEIYKNLREIYERFSDIFGFAILFEARKVSQYDVLRWKELGEEDAKIVQEFAKRYTAYVEESGA